MTLAALVAWFVTAAGGICLLAIWLVEYDQKDAATHLPRTVVSAHALLALGGLVVWSAYLTSDISRLAWTATAILAVVTLLGLTMAIRWIGVYRAYKAPMAVVVPTGASGASSEAAVPPERNLPVPVVIAHGVFAAATIVLVLLTALDVGGS